MLAYTITSAKGSFTSTNITEVCQWQAEFQGAWADINGVDVDSIDYDYDRIDAAVTQTMIVLHGLNGVTLDSYYDHPEGGGIVIGLDSASVMVAGDDGNKYAIPWTAFEASHLIAN